MTMTQPTERPGAFSGRTVPYEIYAKVKQERDEALAEIRFREQLDKVPAKVMSPGQKTAWRVLRAAYKEGVPDDEGWVQLIPAKCAEQAGMSKGTLLEHGSYCEDKLGIMKKRVVTIRDPETHEIIRKDYYIALSEWADQPLHYQVEKEREHGGRRCKCGSANLEIRTIITCRDCGEVVYDSADKKDKKPVNPPVVPTEQVDFMASGPVVEGSLAPETDQGHDGKNMILPLPLLCDEFPVMAHPTQQAGSPAFLAMKQRIREDLARWRHADN